MAKNKKTISEDNQDLETLNTLHEAPTQDEGLFVEDQLFFTYHIDKTFNKIYTNIEKLSFYLEVLISVGELDLENQELQNDLIVLREVYECLEDAEFLMQGLNKKPIKH